MGLCLSTNNHASRQKIYSHSQTSSAPSEAQANASSGPSTPHLSQGYRQQSGPVLQAGDANEEYPAIGALLSTDASAVSRFHAKQWDITAPKPPAEALADVRLTGILGSGGFAVVLRGLWRESTPVAVKVFSTPANRPKGSGELPGSSGSAGLLPERALAELVDAANKQSEGTAARRIPSTPAALLEVIQSFDKARSLTPLRTMNTATRGTAATCAVALCSNKATLPLERATANTADQVVISVGAQEQQGASQHTHHQGADAQHQEAEGPRGQSHESFACDNEEHGPAISWHYILSRLGATTDSILTILIMQEAKLGNLWGPISMGVFDVMKTDYGPSFTQAMHMRALVRTAREIAAGLEHLHVNGVVHGDVKPGNILLTDSRLDKRGFVAMVSDFGLAHILFGSKQFSNETSGTTQYMSPEQLGQGICSFAGDIYAYGILLWEMVTKQHAYEKLRPADVVVGVQLHGLRPTWPPGVMPALESLHTRCVSAMASERPTATAIVQYLKDLEMQVRAASKTGPRARVGNGS